MFNKIHVDDGDDGDDHVYSIMMDTPNNTTL